MAFDPDGAQRYRCALSNSAVIATLEALACLPQDAAGVRIAAEENVGAAREATARALAASDSHDIDAIVCASDALAIGAHLAAVAAGRPDLPVYGFDNTPAAEAMGLSSVEQLPERVAAGVLDLLMGPTGSVVDPQEAAAGSAHVLVVPRLVVRGSAQPV